MLREKINIKFSDDKVINISLNLYDQEIDIDSLLMIDVSKLAAEAVTFPVVLNRLSFLVAEAENKTKERKLDFEIWESKTKEALRVQFNEQKVGTKMTQDYIKSKIYSTLFSSPEYKIKQKQIIKAEKEQQQINSIFWNARDKSEKINLLISKSPQDELDMDDIGQSFNGVRIITKDKLIK